MVVVLENLLASQLSKLTQQTLLLFAKLGRHPHIHRNDQVTATTSSPREYRDSLALEVKRCARLGPRSYLDRLGTVQALKGDLSTECCLDIRDRQLHQQVISLSFKPIRRRYVKVNIEASWLTASRRSSTFTR
jgi:hypothetical protein